MSNSVLEADDFGTFPQRRHSDLTQLVEIAGDRRKMITGESARPGGEVDTAVSDQDLGFAFTFRVEQDQIVLNYRRKPNGGEWEDVEEVVRFDRTACNYGGYGTWFLCPSPRFRLILTLSV